MVPALQWDWSRVDRQPVVSGNRQRNVVGPVAVGSQPITILLVSPVICFPISQIALTLTNLDHFGGKIGQQGCLQVSCRGESGPMEGNPANIEIISNRH